MKPKSPKFLIFLTVFIDLLGFGIVIPISSYIARDYVKSGVETRLAEPVSETDAVIPIQDGAGFPVSGIVTIGGEEISYKALGEVAGITTLGTPESPVSRGEHRTKILSHDAEKGRVELLLSYWPFLIGLLSAVFSFFQMFFAPVWGRASDRVGRRPILLLSLFGSTVSYAIFAMAGSYWMLLIGRIFAGICGANISTAQAYMADITDEKDRTAGMGLIGMAFGLGFTLGPVIGIVSLGIGRWLLPDMPSQFFPGATAAALCLVNFLWAIRGLPESLPPEKRGSAESFRRYAPLREVLAALRHPTLAPLIGIFFLATLGFSNFEVAFGLYIKGTSDLGLSENGLYAVLIYIGLVMAYIQGREIKRLVKIIPEAVLVIAGVALQALGLALFPFIPYWGWMLFAGTFLAIGQGISAPTLSSLTSKAAPPEQQGQTLGITQSASSLGRILGPMLTGLMIFLGSHLRGQTLGLHWPFYSGAALLLAAAWMAVIARRRLLRAVA